MIYLRARFYEPEMNRFSQKDILRGSILQPGSLNRYAYVQNDPVNFVDPSGMRQVAGMYGDGTGRTSTSSSSSRTSYTPPSYPAPSGPARSTASSVNPYNTVKSTSQAVAEARRAMDIATSLTPGSPAAYRATQAYYETQRLAAQAMASHNTQAGIKAVQTSQASVNYVNNVVTGRAPNTYSPYDSHGNVYSYYNSSYDTGKIPTPDAPTIEDVDPGNVEYCEEGEKDVRSNAFLKLLLDIQYSQLYSAANGLGYILEAGRYVFGDYTISVGGVVSGGLGPAGEVSGGLAMDGNGNVGIIFNGGGGAGSAAATGGVSISITNASSIEKLQGGPVLQAGGSLTIGYSVGAEYMSFYDMETGEALGGVNLNLGAGIGALGAIPAELHGVITYSELPLGSINLFALQETVHSMVDKVFDALNGE